MILPKPQVAITRNRKIEIEAVKKPDLQNGFEILSQLEALRAIIRTSLDIFRVQKIV